MEYQFTTVSLAALPGTSLSGILADPGADLKPGTFDDVRVGPDGILMTADDVYLNPIAGATLFILGLENQVIITDEFGRFAFDSIPGGNIKLAADGRTATNAPNGSYFPEMVMDTTFEFEKKRNRPQKYDREKMAVTLRAMKKVAEIKEKRERNFIKKRILSTKKVHEKVKNIKELKQSIEIIGPAAEKIKEKVAKKMQERMTDA